MERRKKPFEISLDNQEDIDEVSLFNQADSVAYNVAAGVDVIAQMRVLMEACAEKHQQFLDYKTAGAEHIDLIKQQLMDGAIAAVDGTDRLPAMTFTTTSIYASGVAWVTSAERGTPTITLTRTTTDEVNIQPEQVKNLDMWALSDEMEQARDEGSWSTTFREYQERKCARDLPEHVQTCFIDGPLFTQNLMTQKLGQDLLGEMVRQDRRYIGVIKGLDGSWPLCRWAAQALDEGEVYVLCTIGQAFQQRFKKEKGGSHSAAPWMDKHAPTYVRCVYRPGEKAFAFECAVEDLTYAVALLREEASKQLGHETPRLIGVVDAFCRHSRNSSQVKDRLLNQVRKTNRRMAEDLSDERISR